MPRITKMIESGRRLAPRTLGHTHDWLARSVELAQSHEAETPPESRSGRGQIFTPAAVARFMAEMIRTNTATIRLLDPGAGVGMLSAAVCERVSRLRAPRRLEIDLFESDTRLLDLLSENLSESRRRLADLGHELVYSIHDEDFLLSDFVGARSRPLFAAPATDGNTGFDAVIMNPPYLKLAKGSEHARALAEIVHGQPNLYALFMAAAVDLLRPEGQLIAITPRSFCNGLYFRGFRRWFFDRMALRHLHLFESRTAAFAESEVLQESLITSASRLGALSTEVMITTSRGRDLSSGAAGRSLPSARIMDDTCGDLVVRIPGDETDLAVMDLVEAWPQRFSDLGLRISTGPVVAFRAVDHLVDDAETPNTVPLYSVQNVRPFETIWPRAKRGKPVAIRVSDATRPLLIPRRTYVLLRRFSAKEEDRRLTASCLFRREAAPDGVALENHLNYVCHAERGLTDDEALGLAALFNSRVLDRYFRTISGNTQVNATEIRTMPFPALDVIARIGRRIRDAGTGDRRATERIVLDELGASIIVSSALIEATT